MQRSSTCGAPGPQPRKSHHCREWVNKKVLIAQINRQHFELMIIEPVSLSIASSPPLHKKDYKIPSITDMYYWYMALLLVWPEILRKCVWLLFPFNIQGLFILVYLFFFVLGLEIILLPRHFTGMRTPCLVDMMNHNVSCYKLASKINFSFL